MTARTPHGASRATGVPTVAPIVISDTESVVRHARRAWIALAALLALGAIGGVALPPQAIDWQPSLALAEPWRAWSAAWRHFGAAHLAANLAATVLVAALGAAARLPPRAAVAWAIAWPLTHAALLAVPALAHYGGLSGVLHAGVAVAAIGLVAQRGRRERAVGAALLAGLAVKVLAEAPWQGALRREAGWDFPVAVAAHASGVLAGVCCAIGAELVARRRRRRP